MSRTQAVSLLRSAISFPDHSSPIPRSLQPHSQAILVTFLDHSSPIPRSSQSTVIEFHLSISSHHTMISIYLIPSPSPQGEEGPGDKARWVYVDGGPPYTTVQGLIQGGWIGWLATPPLGFGVSIKFFVWALSDLLEQTILVNQVFDEMQINHSDKTYIEQKVKQRSLLHSLMMVVEYRQLQFKSTWIDTKQLTCPNG